MNEPNNQEIALSLRDVSIKYRVVRPISFRSLFRLKSAAPLEQKSKYFQAVKGVSFDVRRGEIVGIIGKNGSGKSTLLRAIANIYTPDEGTIDTHGNTVGLMAIGVGFVKELSGRDNIYLSGFLQGLTKQEIENLTEPIVTFSELGSFIDAPVESYSSGMHSKLAFSISTVFETDIMLVDETLSVGDRSFRQKSEQKMLDLINDENKTVLIVSHNLSTLSNLCSRVIWLDKGVLRMDGPTQEVIDAYIETVDKDVIG